MIIIITDTRTDHFSQPAAGSTVRQKLNDFEFKSGVRFESENCISPESIPESIPDVRNRLTTLLSKIFVNGETVWRDVGGTHAVRTALSIGQIQCRDLQNRLQSRGVDYRLDYRVGYRVGYRADCRVDCKICRVDG